MDDAHGASATLGACGFVERACPRNWERRNGELLPSLARSGESEQATDHEQASAGLGDDRGGEPEADVLRLGEEAAARPSRRPQVAAQLVEAPAAKGVRARIEARS